MHSDVTFFSGLWIRILKCGSGSILQICINKLPYEEFSGVEKDKKDCSKVENHGTDPNLPKKIIKLQLLPISFNFFWFFLFIFDPPTTQAWPRVHHPGYEEPDPTRHPHLDARHGLEGHCGQQGSHQHGPAPSRVLSGQKEEKNTAGRTVYSIMNVLWRSLLM